MMNSKTFSIFALIVATLIWGSTFMIIRHHVVEVQAATFLSYRFLIAAFFLALYLLLWKRKNVFSNFKNGILLGIPLGIFYFLQTIGLKYTTAVNSGFMTSLLVLYVPLFNFIVWKKKPTFGHVLALFFSVIGMFIMTQGITGWNRGDVFTLLGAGCGALHILLIERLIQKADLWILNFQQFFVMGILSLLYAWVFHEKIFISSPTTIFSLLYLAIFATIIAFGLQLFSQKCLSAVTVSLILTLEPIFSAMFAWTLGSEVFSFRTAISGSMIVFALFVSELWPKQKIIEE